MNAFSAYAGAGAYGFAGADRGATSSADGPATGLGGISQNGKEKKENGSAPAAVANGDEDEDDVEKEKGTSFGDRLRAGKDEESEEGSEEERGMKLQEQEGASGSFYWLLSET